MLRYFIKSIFILGSCLAISACGQSGSVPTALPTASATLILTLTETSLPTRTPTITPMLDGTPTLYVERTCAPVQSRNPNPTPDNSVQWEQDASTGIYYPRIPIPAGYDTNSREQRVEVVKRLVTLWLEHGKTDKASPRDAIRDYELGKIVQREPIGDPSLEIAGTVEFSIIPVQIPNNYASYPGEIPGDLCSWWHILEARFGVYRDGNYFRLGSDPNGSP